MLRKKVIDAILMLITYWHVIPIATELGIQNIENERYACINAKPHYHYPTFYK